LNITGDEGGGIHFQGRSRDGKTTTQYIGGSVAGSRDITQTWRATDNGLEAVCEERCDGLLCLDEIGQIEPKVAGKIAYMIANGEGKSRMMNSTALRRTKKWRVLFLSSGEVGLAELMAEEGKKTRAGQQIRLLEVPSNAGAGYGIFEDIHGFESPKLFADHLRNVTREVHGAPLRGFLDQIAIAFAKGPAALRSELRHQRDQFVRDNLTAGASGQVGSACARFGLIATAGEVATGLGLTGWPEGTAINSARKCFRAWLEKRGSTGDYDLEAAVRQVIAYVEQFGNSRFEDLNSEGFVTGLRVGFRKHDKHQTEYLVLPTLWQTELCKGYDAKAVADEMIRRGLLIPDKHGKSSTSMRLGHHGQMRVYRLSPTIINGGAEPDTRTEAQRNKDVVVHMMTDPVESGGEWGETPSQTPETPLKHVFH
jgi:putative DNA primase/helicase